MDTTSVRMKFAALGRNDLATGPLEVAECRIALGLKAAKAVLVVSPTAVSVLAGVDWRGNLPPKLHELDAVLNEADIAAVEIQMPVPEMVALHGISLPERVSVERSRIPIVRIGASRGFIIDLVLTDANEAMGIATALATTLGSADRTAKTDRRIREIVAEQLGEDVSRPDRVAYYFGTTLDEDLDPVMDVVLAVSMRRVGVIDVGLFTGDAEGDDTCVQDIEDMTWGRIGLPPGSRLPFTAAGLVAKNLPGPMTLALGFDDGDRWTIRMAEPADGRPAPGFYAELLQRLDHAIAEK